MTERRPITLHRHMDDYANIYELITDDADPPVQDEAITAMSDTFLTDFFTGIISAERIRMCKGITQDYIDRRKGGRNEFCVFIEHHASGRRVYANRLFNHSDAIALVSRLSQTNHKVAGLMLRKYDFEPLPKTTLPTPTSPRETGET